MIEMLRELDSDMSGFQFRLLNHWTEYTDIVWKTQLVTMVKKKNGKLTMRGFRPIAMLPTIWRLFSKALQHVPGRQAHEVVWMLRRVVEQATEGQIQAFVMDCDVAAAFDHVSHHGIIEATLAMGVPPVLIAARIGEYKNSETIVKLDDIWNPGIRRTRSVPQSDPCHLGQPCSAFGRTAAGSSRCRLESSKQWQERGPNC